MGWERKRGKLHELNLLLRGDNDTTFLPPDEKLPDGVVHVMTLDADTKMTRDSVTKLVGKLSHPLNRPVIDEADAPRRRGLLDPAAARDGIADDGRRSVLLPARLLGQSRPRPLRLRRVRPLPGRVRRRHLHRQGALPCRRLRGGAEGPHPRKHRAQPRPSGRRAEPLRRWSPTSRSSRTIRRAIRSTPRATTAGRAATGSCCATSSIRRSGVPALSRWKMIDNLRRSLTPIFWVMAAIAGWTLLPFTQAAQWQALLILALFMAPTFQIIDSILPKSSDATARGHFSGARPRRRLRYGHGGGEGRADGASGLDDGRCHRAHALPPVRQPQEPARMALGVRGAQDRRNRSDVLLRLHVRRGADRARRADDPGRGGFDRRLRRLLLRHLLGRFARLRLADQPLGRDGRPAARVAIRREGPARRSRGAPGPISRAR